MDRIPEIDQPQYEKSFDEADLNAKISDAASVNDNTSGVTNVELNKINLEGVNSPNDFTSPEQYHGMVREAQMLGQMQPAVEKGMTVDTFDSWDKANRIGNYSPDDYIRGYVDVFHTYYDGSETVALEPKGNGTFNIINGRHRIYAVRSAGLTTIPAKII